MISTLLARILNLVLALIIITILEFLVAILVVLILVIIILTLGILEMCLGGIIVFAPWIEATISPRMSSVDQALFLGARMFLP